MKHTHHLVIFFNGGSPENEITVCVRNRCLTMASVSSSSILARIMFAGKHEADAYDCYPSTTRHKSMVCVNDAAIVCNVQEG